MKPLYCSRYKSIRSIVTALVMIVMLWGTVPIVTAAEQADPPKHEKFDFFVSKIAQVIVMEQTGSGLETYDFKQDSYSFSDTDIAIGIFFLDNDIPSSNLSEQYAIIEAVSETDQTEIPFTTQIETSKTGLKFIMIEFHPAPTENMSVRLLSPDRNWGTTLNLKYSKPFTYRISSSNPDVERYFKTAQSDLVLFPFHMVQGKPATFAIEFSLDADRASVMEALDLWLKGLDMQEVWIDDRHLTIKLTIPKDFKIDDFLYLSLNGVRSTNGSKLRDPAGFAFATSDLFEYRLLELKTGKGSKLFSSTADPTRYLISPNGKYLLFQELAVDSDVLPVPAYSLLSLESKKTEPKLIKRFPVNSIHDAQWLPGSQSFVYISGNSLLVYDLQTNKSDTVWTLPSSLSVANRNNWISAKVNPMTGAVAVMINHAANSSDYSGNSDLLLFNRVKDAKPKLVKNARTLACNNTHYVCAAPYTYVNERYIIAASATMKAGLDYEPKIQWLLIDAANGSKKPLQASQATVIDTATLLIGANVSVDDPDINYALFDLKSGKKTPLTRLPYSLERVWPIGGGTYVVAMRDENGQNVTMQLDVKRKKLTAYDKLPKDAEILDVVGGFLYYAVKTS